MSGQNVTANWLPRPLNHRLPIFFDCASMKKPDPTDVAGVPEVRVLQMLQAAPELLEMVTTSTDKETTLQERLRADYIPELVRAALRLRDVRRRADGILPDGDRLWLTGRSFEQATALEVACHKASRFPAGESIEDLCCGIGMDTRALLARGPVQAVDSDPAMLLRNEWNQQIWYPDGLPHPLMTERADVSKRDSTGTLLHVDPDRRAGRDRPTKRLEMYQPDLTWMEQTIESAPGGAIKIGPASNFVQKFAGCEIELVSLHGECREATVWFGSLAGEKRFRATSLPTGESICGNPLEAWCPESDVGQFLFDPDPAVVRSGLLDAVGQMHNLHRLDSADEYLTGDAIPSTAFVTAFRVEAVMGNNPKELKRYLRQKPGSHYEIKCRHLKVDANQLQKKLPRGAGSPRVVFFVRVSGKAKVVVCERM